MAQKLSIEEAEKEFIRVARGLVPEKLVEIDSIGLVHLEKPKAFGVSGSYSELLASELRIIFNKEIIGEKENG